MTPHKRRLLIAAGWMGCMLAGCSPGARALSRNEINEPVFHETNFASLGAGAGPVADRTRDPGGYRSDYYFMPRFQYDVKVGSWASFTVLPVFWNFLLGGSQYSGNLSDIRIGKPLIALHGGVSGFSYSQRDGFDFPGAAALSGKYLFNASWFAYMEGAAELRDVRSTANSAYGLSLGLGNQFTAKNSVKLEYAIRYFRFEPGLRYSDHDLWFGNGNAQTKLLLRHSYYPSPRHVLGPEFIFSFKDSDLRKEHYLALGLHYDYRF